MRNRAEATLFNLHWTHGFRTIAQAFDVPQLRGIADTGPYFRDNSAATLEDVIDL